MIALAELNQADDARFLQLTGGALEGELWLAERVLKHRPFVDIDAVIAAFATEIQAASDDEKIRLLASHPDLGVKVADGLSRESVKEQASAGLNQLTETEYEQFQEFNAAYKARFNFPFVICAREHNKHSILAAFRDRLIHTHTDEITIGSNEIIKIIRLRLLDTINPSESSA